MNTAMERHVINHRQWKVVVFCKRATDGLLIPLRFDIYYGGTKVNALVGEKHLKAIDAAIHEQFTGKLN